MLLEESFAARGHPNIRATHEKTIEITKETHLTTQGDCIAAIEAEKGLADLGEKMRRAARNPESVITLTLMVNDKAFTTVGQGHPSLTWEHPTDMVARISGYVCKYPYGPCKQGHDTHATILRPTPQGSQYNP